MTRSSGDAFAGADFIEYAKQFQRTDPAESAAATGLILRKTEKIPGDIDHAIPVIKYHHSPGAHHRTHIDQFFIINRNVTHGRRDTATRRSTNLYCLELTVICDSPANLLNNFADGHAHRHFDEPAIPDLPGEREYLCSMASGGTDCCKLLCAIADDPGNAGKGLTIVDKGWLPPIILYLMDMVALNPGVPRLPSIDLRSAVSSPQTNAPAPSTTLKSIEKIRV